MLLVEPAVPAGGSYRLTMPDDSHLQPLSEADEQLVRAAYAVIASNADEQGRHTVGAAVRDAAGKIHVGVNLAHFTGGPCAELVAMATARASGSRELAAIVAVRRDGSILGPCGRDRQVLLDYHPNIEVILPLHPSPKKIAAAELLPWGAAWSPSSGTGEAIQTGNEPDEPATPSH